MMPNNSSSNSAAPDNDNAAYHNPETHNIEPVINKETNGNVDRISPEEADRIADELVEKFGSSESRAFYCKAAYALTELEIEELAKTAQEKGHSPGALFNYLVSRRMREINTRKSS
jgi:hypothetical protein